MAVKTEDICKEWTKRDQEADKLASLEISEKNRQHLNRVALRAYSSQKKTIKDGIENEQIAEQICRPEHCSVQKAEDGEQKRLPGDQGHEYEQADIPTGVPDHARESEVLRVGHTNCQGEDVDTQQHGGGAEIPGPRTTDVVGQAHQHQGNGQPDRPT